MSMKNINIPILSYFRVVELFLFSAMFLLLVGAVNAQNVQGPQLKFTSQNTVVCEGAEMIVQVSNLPSSFNSVYWSVPSDWLVNGENIDGIDFENDTLVIVTVGATSGSVSATVAGSAANSNLLVSTSFTVIPASLFELDAPAEACENEEIVISCSGPATYNFPASWQVLESAPSLVKAIPFGGGKAKAVSTGLCHFEDSISIVENKSQKIAPVNDVVYTAGMADFSVSGPDDDHYTWYPYPGGRPFANYGGGEAYNTSHYSGYVEDSLTLYAVYTNSKGCESQPVPVTVQVAKQRTLLITANQTQEDIHVSVGPNPFTDTFSMEFSDQLQQYEFQLFNTTGQVVSSGITDKNQNEFGHNLSSGIYYLTVLDGVRSQTIKLIKQ